MAQTLSKTKVIPSSRREEEQFLHEITDQLVLALRGAIAIREQDLVLFIKMAIHEAGLARDRKVEAGAS